MSDPFVGEIKIFAGNFAPLGWALCDGQLMSIADFDALYSLIGTTYGGDGVATFGLPDMRGRLPLHAGQGPGLSPYVLGQRAGAEEVTLSTLQLPSHSHVVMAQSGKGDKPTPNGMALATASTFLYSPYGSSVANMNTQALGMAGGSQPHDNMMPFQCLNFIIALEGIYPTQN